MIPPKPPLRTKKIQAFLTEEDYETLRIHAEENGEPAGALASRALSRFAEDVRDYRAVRTTPTDL